MSKSTDSNPISSFIAGILGIILLYVMINVIIIADEKEKAGKPINLVKITVQSIHKVYTDATTGWDEANKN